MTARRLSLILAAVTIAAATIYYLLPEPALPDKPITQLVVFKSKKILQAYSGDELLKTYSISLGGNPTGDKQNEGGKKTPEGKYFINGKNPGSGYHKNLGISYPNTADIKEAQLRGQDPGGEIKIHGIRNGFGFIGKFHRLLNWTAGCIAVTDHEIDELYEHVPVGTPIVIRP